MIRTLCCGLCLLLSLSFAVAENPLSPPLWQQSQAGMIVDPVLEEVSGLAASRWTQDRLWVLNDSGNKPALYALSLQGALLGTLDISGAKNTDWEDMASFSLDGKNYILIGDMGDNLGRRRDCRFYLIEEPMIVAEKGSAPVVAVIPFSYEDGPRDVESVAVDVTSKKILLLSKREKITALYELPLVLQSPKAPLVAKKIATMESLPQPTKQDRDAIPMMGPYVGQPTGMDIKADGSSLVVLTYLNVFLYPKKPGESWTQAVGRVPQVLPRHNLIQAEAICFARDGKTIFVTSERRIASPLVRYDEVPVKK